MHNFLLVILVLLVVMPAIAADEEKTDEQQAMECTMPTFQLLMPSSTGIAPGGTATLISGVIEGVGAFSTASIEYANCLAGKASQGASHIGEGIHNYLKQH